MSIHHECRARDTKDYRKTISQLSDSGLLNNISQNDEFKRKTSENNIYWRDWCRLALQEANKRGLKVPPRKERT